MSILWSAGAKRAVCSALASLRSRGDDVVAVGVALGVRLVVAWSRSRDACAGPVGNSGSARCQVVGAVGPARMTTTELASPFREHGGRGVKGALIFKTENASERTMPMSADESPPARRHVGFARIARALEAGPHGRRT